MRRCFAIALTAVALVVGLVVVPVANAGTGGSDAGRITEVASLPAAPESSAENGEILRHFGTKCEEVRRGQWGVSVCAFFNDNDFTLFEFQAVGTMTFARGCCPDIRMRIRGVSLLESVNGSPFRRVRSNPNDVVSGTRAELFTEPIFCAPLGTRTDFIARISYSIRWPDGTLFGPETLQTDPLRTIC